MKIVAKKHKFDGVPFTPKTKCIGCEHLEDCRNCDQSTTLKCILLECESFYYVFKKLEEFEKRPFNDGNTAQYSDSLLAYEKEHESVPMLTYPLVVNGAFAAELALKFLIFQENLKFDCIHSLYQLFYQLPSKHKVPLTEIIYKQARQNAKTLEVNLSNIANLFEDFRYAFGKEQLGFTNFFNDFIHIVCDYAIQQKKIDEE